MTAGWIEDENSIWSKPLPMLSYDSGGAEIPGEIDLNCDGPGKIFLMLSHPGTFSSVIASGSIDLKTAKIIAERLAKLMRHQERGCKQQQCPGRTCRFNGYKQRG